MFTGKSTDLKFSSFYLMSHRFGVSTKALSKVVQTLESNGESTFGYVVRPTPAIRLNDRIYCMLMILIRYTILLTSTFSDVFLASLECNV